LVEPPASFSILTNTVEILAAPESAILQVSSGSFQISMAVKVFDRKSTFKVGTYIHLTNNHSYMKLLKPTITYIQANIKFVKTGNHR
jgi:hypothetical protein